MLLWCPWLHRALKGNPALEAADSQQDWDMLDTSSSDDDTQTTDADMVSCFLSSDTASYEPTLNIDCFRDTPVQESVLCTVLLPRVTRRILAHSAVPYMAGLNGY